MKPNTLDTLQLERLVDGELPPEDYRRVLRELNEQPQGWKQLAVLFLEAQALRVDLPQVMPRREMPAAKEEPQVQPVAKTSSLPMWSALFAAAACLLIGFAVGWNVRRESMSQPLVAQLEPGKFAEEPQPADVPALSSAEYVGHQFSVPVYTSQNIDPSELWRESTPLPPAMLERARELHQQVVREYQVLPVELEDGRQMVLPIERVKFVPTPTY